jgi:magnesium transporter
MTDHTHLSSGPTAPLPAFRDEEGALDPRFLALVETALESDDADALGALVTDLHEADQATLLEAIDHDQRPTFIELLGPAFDFAALTEVDDAVREEILEELDTETLVEGVRELESDDAVYIL